jgi:hypothetical protein
MKNMGGIENIIDGNIMNGSQAEYLISNTLCIIGDYYPKTSKLIIRVFL